MLHRPSDVLFISSPKALSIQCPYNCVESAKKIVKNGFLRRRLDGARIQRFRCCKCLRTFSSARLRPDFRQRKRSINVSLYGLLASGVSQRRSARLLTVNLKTIARRLNYLTKLCEEESKNIQTEFLDHFLDEKVQSVQFDEVETFEHTKCKPISIALAVESKSRFILGQFSSSMPPKGLLASISLKKYGRRVDHRMHGLQNLMDQLKNVCSPTVLFLSDECPRYPKILKKNFERALHKTVKSRRGCITGQGELKKIGRDPLFSLNHTAAMFRANINRLFRRTWCTTKNIKYLDFHLKIYVVFHNTHILEGLKRHARKHKL